VLAGLLASGLLGLTGCGGFFPATTTTTTGTNTPTTGTDFVFALAPVLGTVSTYTIGSGTLTAGTALPITLPTALVSATAGAVTVSRSNQYLYVGGVGAIYCYLIGASGTLTLESANSLTGLSANFVSLDTSPDGDWLFALDSASKNVYQFALNITSGALTSQTTVAYTITSTGANSPRKIHAGATGSGLVVASLGTAGDAIFKYTTTSGLTYYQTINTGSATLSDNDALLDSTGTYLYVSRSGYTGTTPVGEVDTYNMETLTVASTAAAGTTPYSLLIDSSGNYLYVSNRGDSTVSEYSIAAGALTALATPTASIAMVGTSLAADNTGLYILAGGIAATANLHMYTLSTGELVSSTTATVTGTGLTTSVDYDTAGLQLATTH